MRSALIHLIAGARPNFMKLAPVVHALRRRGEPQFRVVHTGQHYDPQMNDVFFQELGLPAPDIHLGVGAGTHAVQTARILEGYEQHLLNDPPAGIVVFGDVNSTIACALAAVKLGIPIAHVEAGLRSLDRSMPEEINRILTDAISDLLLVSDPSGLVHLGREGVPPERIRYVGNVMIDTLFAEREEAQKQRSWEDLGLSNGGYALATLHRPSNVDSPEVLRPLINELQYLSTRLPIVWPIHPRTRNSLTKHGFLTQLEATPTIRLLAPQPYRSTLSLMIGAKLVLTDSGGIQEETSALRIPCLTLRDTTERPVTLELGTSRLVGNDPRRIREGFEAITRGDWPQGSDIPLWDGQTANRIAKELGYWMERRLHPASTP